MPSYLAVPLLLVDSDLGSCPGGSEEPELLCRPQGLRSLSVAVVVLLPPPRVSPREVGTPL